MNIYGQQVRAGHAVWTLPHSIGAPLTLCVDWLAVGITADHLVRATQFTVVVYVGHYDFPFLVRTGFAGLLAPDFCRQGICLMHQPSYHACRT